MMIAEEIIAGYYRIRNYVKSNRYRYIKALNREHNLQKTKEMNIKDHMTTSVTEKIKNKSKQKFYKCAMLRRLKL
jgi:hypothetical protein